MKVPRDAKLITAYDRAYILPNEPRHDMVGRPPGRRSLSRGRQAIVLGIVTRPQLGTPLAVAAIGRAEWRGGRYCLIEQRLVPGDDLLDAERHALRQSGFYVWKSRHDFSRRVLIAGGYEAGIMVGAWDLRFVLSRFALDVRFGRQATARHMTLPLVPNKVGDPRLRIRAWDGMQTTIEWARFLGYRSRELDDHDVFSGLFLDLRRHAHMYSAERLTFSDACELFEIVPPPDLDQAEKVTEETLTRLFLHMRTAIDLTTAIVREWNSIGGVAARIPSPHPHD